MPSCEYCGAKVGQGAYHEMLLGGKIYVCGKIECDLQMDKEIDQELEEMEDAASVDMDEDPEGEK